jgi:hypothetical protein
MVSHWCFGRGGLVMPLLAVVMLSAGCPDTSSDEPPLPPPPSASVASPQESPLAEGTDYRGVCKREPYASAPEYNPNRRGPHGLIAFVRLRTRTYEPAPITYPEWWQMELDRIAPRGKPELVACMHGFYEKEKTCDGYRSASTGEPFSIVQVGRSYDVRVREARTGERVALGRVESYLTKCPPVDSLTEPPAEPLDADFSEWLLNWLQVYAFPPNA